MRPHRAEGAIGKSSDPLLQEGKRVFIRGGEGENRLTSVAVLL